MVSKCVMAGAWATRTREVRRRTMRKGQVQRGNCGMESIVWYEKINNGTYEKALIKSVHSNIPFQRWRGPDQRGAVCGMCDVDRREFRGGACES